MTHTHAPTIPHLRWFGGTCYILAPPKFIFVSGGVKTNKKVYQRMLEEIVCRIEDLSITDGANAWMEKKLSRANSNIKEVIKQKKYGTGCSKSKFPKIPYDV